MGQVTPLENINFLGELGTTPIKTVRAPNTFISGLLRDEKVKDENIGSVLSVKRMLKYPRLG